MYVGSDGDGNNVDLKVVVRLMADCNDPIYKQRLSLSVARIHLKYAEFSGSR